jgi:hypothetical protein
MAVLGLGILGAGLAGAGANIFGSITGSNAAEQALTAGEAASVSGMEQSQNQYSILQNILAPYLATGQTGTSLLNYLMGGAAPTATAGLTSDQQAQLSQAQQYVQAYTANPNPEIQAKYAAQYQNAVDTINTLTQQQNAAQASQGLPGAVQNLNQQGFGQGSLLNTAMNLTGGPNAYSQFQNSPYYQAMVNAMNLGTGNLAAQSAAGGTFGSGTMGAGLLNLAQQTGSQYYGGYQSGTEQALQNVVNMLTGQTNTGLTGASQLSSASNTLQSNTSNNLSNLASVIGSGALTSAGLQTGAATGITNQLSSGLGTYMNYMNYSNLANAIKGLNGGTNAGTNLTGAPTASSSSSLLDLWGV